MPGPSDIQGSALVVDDDRAVAALLATFLERLGLTVTTAHSLEEAQKHLEAGDWTLMVTDLQLGSGAGSEGLTLLDRARSDWPATRTILVSGSAVPETASEARQRGADLFFSKPVSFANFSLGVRSLLGT